MQRATMPPSWLSPWPGVVVYGPPNLRALDYYRAVARERARQRSRLTIYTYGHDDKILRIGGWGGAGGAGGAGAGAENTARPVTGWERYPVESPYDHYPLNQLAAPPDLHHLPGVQRVNVEWVPGRGVGVGVGAGHEAASRTALRAWVIGSAIIVLLIAIVRAVEKCLDVKVLKILQRTEEWQTPNVRATRQPGADDTVTVPGLEGEEPSSADFRDAIGDFSDVTTDLPPPYAECTGAGPDSGAPKTTVSLHYEDPPPAYSQVQFSNKNGVPSVLIVSRRRSPLPDRSDVSAAETDNADHATAEQNTENTNIEITNGAAGNLESLETTDGTDTSSNDQTMTADMNGSNAANSGTSTCETTVDIGEDENTLKGAVVIV